MLWWPLAYDVPVNCYNKCLVYNKEIWCGKASLFLGLVSTFATSITAEGLEYQTS